MLGFINLKKRMKKIETRFSNIQNINEKEELLKLVRNAYTIMNKNELLTSGQLRTFQNELKKLEHKKDELHEKIRLRGGFSLPWYMPWFVDDIRENEYQGIQNEIDWVEKKVEKEEKKEKKRRKKRRERLGTERLYEVMLKAMTLAGETEVIIKKNRRPYRDTTVDEWNLTRGSPELKAFSERFRGNYEEALKLYKSLKDKTPEQETELVELLIHNGKFQEAKRTIEKTENYELNSRLLTYLICAYHATGNLEKARTIFDSLKTIPDERNISKLERTCLRADLRLGSTKENQEDYLEVVQTIMDKEWNRTDYYEWALRAAKHLNIISYHDFRYAIKQKAHEQKRKTFYQNFTQSNLVNIFVKRKN